MGKVKKDDSKRKSKKKRERMEVAAESGEAPGDGNDIPETKLENSSKEDVNRNDKENRKGEKARSDGSAQSTDDMDTLQLNSKFAQQYEVRKRREILSSLAPDALEELERDSQDSEDSIDEEEDEYGELLTKKLDNQIRKTIIALQSKDPVIYKKETMFFKGSRNDIDVSDAEEGNTENDSAASSEDEPVAGWDTITKAAEAAAPKMTIKDYVRETLLQEGELPDSDDERRRRRRHVDEENEEVAREKTILKEESDSESESSSDSGENDSDDDTNGRDDSGDNEVGNDDSGDNDDEDDNDDDEDDDEFFKKKEKTKEELEQEEKDFGKFTERLASKSRKGSGEETLLHSYLEKDTKDEKERFLRDFVLSNGWLEKEAGPAPGPRDYTVEIDLPAVGLDGEEEEDDEEFEDRVDAFEAKYNFRFEEPDGIQVASHARSVSDSLRRPDDRRKRAREARKLRKEKEKLVKAEEIKHLKNLKKKEVQSRLLALQEAAGAGMDFSGIDLDADFDPEEFSRQMESKFGEEYYNQEDKELKSLKKLNAIVSEHRPDAADVVAKNNDIEAEKEPELQTAVDRLMDEYYNLDYEDIVDGVPIRFNYKQVEPETFGMTAEEVLAEDDKELNQRASLKYLAPYRDRKEVKARAKTARWRAKQRRRNTSKNDTDEHEQPKKRKKKKSRNQENETEPTSNGDAVGNGDISKKASKKKRKAESLDQNSNGADAGGNDKSSTQSKRKKRRRGGKTYYVDVEEPKGGTPKFSAKEQKREQKKKAVMERLSEKRLAAYNIN